MTAIPFRIVDPTLVSGAIPIRTAPAGLTGAVRITAADPNQSGSIPVYYSSNPSAMPVTDVTPSGSYDTDSTAYFTAMTVQPDSTRKGLLDAFITGLKADGVWTSLEWLTLLAGHDAQADRLNVITPSQSLTAVGSLTYTTDRGVTSDGTTGYFVVAADNAAVKATQNSATYGIYMNTSVSTNSAAGLATSSNIRINPYTGTTLAARVNGTINLTGVVADGLGLSAAVRSDASTLTAYRGASQVGTTAASTSAALTGENIQLLKVAAAFSTSRIAAYVSGSALDATKIAALNTRLSTYLTAIGAN